MDDDLVRLTVSSDVSVILYLVVPSVLAGLFLGAAAISAWVAWHVERWQR